MPPAVPAREPVDLPENATLADFLRVAEARNPGLESSRRIWRAEAEGAEAAGSWPDPQLSFAWYAEEVETRVGPQKQRLSVRQRLPWFGKLRLRELASIVVVSGLGAGLDFVQFSIGLIQFPAGDGSPLLFGAWVFGLWLNFSATLSSGPILRPRPCPPFP